MTSKEDLISVSIIGSASSKNNKTHEDLLNKNTWDKLCSIAETHITSKICDNWSKINLVSGGAAWCDHLAVHLHKKYPQSKLTLHFPCKWDSNKNQYVDNGLYH